ncbi:MULTISPECIES: LysR family transcriptional regulator [Caballeronia]|jgi:DNA-binding transcriptional LysR family regulator|uniref:LysR family transcriptional regulator n=1 Tax=Caballeronia zhejiangensis TaxID=871203 RepID=A0A656QQ59_9BURK|nr:MULTISPECIES: LysR family transcriptional regulator [Caballeronia]EKS68828.1 LysR family transcriptional regulator [Burkholderia sp. SJ98]KDR33068.1 LysR family transcriptional regulator [Caballeronia zhejiangensis]MCG7399411.1 LysR family transcriptional regulator [Caballeronia zhejiangensis]MCI1042064.1 LysR family transcriptional regulator [Caballeronia zhejiangensis]MDR5764092.1 LysR family transcriptional regulator [Caballeronia sp. LZ028]
MNQLQAMRVFLKVAETESFGRAANALDLSNAVITRYVSLLEAHLNTRLLNRTTRSVSLTEAGRAYADGCRAVIEQIETIEASVGNSSVDPSGTLKLVASASFSLLGLTPMLRGFRERYPNVKLRLTLLHRPVDLVAEGFDVGIVVPHLVNSGMLINRPLVRVAAVLVAAPAYLAQRRAPVGPASLASHEFLAPSSDIHGSTWSFIGPSGETESVELDPAYSVNSSHMLRQAALSGMGIAVLPESYVAQDIEVGSLVRLLPGHTLKDADKEVSIVYPGRRHVSAKTRAFVDFALAYFRDGELADASPCTPTE